MSLTERRTEAFKRITEEMERLKVETLNYDAALTHSREETKRLQAEIAQTIDSLRRLETGCKGARLFFTAKIATDEIARLRALCGKKD
jgi:hypothetical protein